MRKLILGGLWSIAWFVALAVVVWTWQLPPRPQVILKVETGVGLVQFSPDGRWLVTSRAEEGTRYIDLWDAQSGAQKHRLWNESAEANPYGGSSGLRFSSDGRWLLTPRGDRVQVFDTNRGQWVEELNWEGQFGRTYRFSPASRWLSVHDEGHCTLRVYDLQTLTSWVVGSIRSRARDDELFFVDGDRKLVCFDEEGRSFSFWDIASHRKEAEITVPWDVYAFQPSPDGQSLAALVSETEWWRKRGPWVCCWNVADCRLRFQEQIKLCSDARVAFSPDGQTLAVATDHDSGGTGLRLAIELRDALTGTVRSVLRTESSGSDRWDFSPDGRLIRFQGPAWCDLWWDLSRQPPEPISVAQLGHAVERWKREQASWVAPTPPVLWWDTRVIATHGYLSGPGPSPDVESGYSPDGHWYIVRVGYDRQMGQARQWLGQHFPMVLNYGQPDHEALLVDLRTGQTVCSLPSAGPWQFSPDGTSLAVRGDGADDVRLYHLPVPRRWAEPLVATALLIGLTALISRRLLLRRRQPA